jgi:hypothetical protein
MNDPLGRHRRDPRRVARREYPLLLAWLTSSPLARINDGEERGRAPASTWTATWLSTNWPARNIARSASFWRWPNEGRR